MQLGKSISAILNKLAVVFNLPAVKKIVIREIKTTRHRAEPAEPDTHLLIPSELKEFISWVENGIFAPSHDAMQA